MAYKDKKTRQEYQREYRKNNKDRLAKYRQDNKERLKVANDAHRGRNRDLVNEAKRVPCVDCWQHFPPCAMDLHHIDPDTKIAAVSQMLHMNSEAVLAEIAKCEVICANCHRIRHNSKEELDER